MALKRKVMGLTMLVDKVYNEKHKHIYNTYTFINPVSLNVYNIIVCELGNMYSMVLSDVKDKEVETDYGFIEACYGSIRCYTTEQRSMELSK